MNTNITETWQTTKSAAIQAWRDLISENLEPKLEERGVVVNSYAFVDPAPGNEYEAIWFCTKGTISLEIHASTATAFYAIVTDTDTGESLGWPTSPMSTYDRKNYTVKQLIEWLDKQPWIQ